MHFPFSLPNGKTHFHAKECWLKVLITKFDNVTRKKQTNEEDKTETRKYHKKKKTKNKIGSNYLYFDYGIVRLTTALTLFYLQYTRHREIDGKRRRGGESQRERGRESNVNSYSLHTVKALLGGHLMEQREHISDPIKYLYSGLSSIAESIQPERDWEKGKRERRGRLQITWPILKQSIRIDIITDKSKYRNSVLFFHSF